MKTSILFLSILSLVFSSAIQANNGKFALNLSAGVSYNYLNPGPLVLPHGVEDKLMPDDVKGYSFMPGFGIEYTSTMPQSIASYIAGYSIGLDMSLLNHRQIGTVLQESDPRFNNYFYNLKIDTARLMLSGQLLFAPIKNISPFLEAGIGRAHLHTKYSETPNVNEGIIDSNITLESHTQYNFAYSLGAGFKIPVTSHFTSTVGYQFTDLGHVKTSAYTSPQHIHISPIDARLFSNALYLKLSYIFG